MHLLALPFILIFFLPFTQDYYETNKWFLLLIIALFTVAIWAIKSIISGKINLNFTKGFFGWLGLTIAAISSLIIASSNKIEALVSLYGVATFLAFTLITIFSPNVSPKNKSLLKWLFFGVNAFLGLIAIYQYFGITKLFLPNVNYIASPLWTPIGSSLALVVILIIVTPLLIQELITTIQKKENLKIIIASIFSLLVILGNIFTLIKLIPIVANTSLPLLVGWSIALETLKTPLQAVFGVGAENFIVAQTLGRPVGVNILPIWNLIFNTNFSFVFHIIPTLGILGLLGSLALVHAIWPEKKLTGLNFSLFLSVLALFLVPPTLPLLVVIAILLALKEKVKPISPTVEESNKWGKLAIPASLLLAIFIGISIYGMIRHYSAEYQFHQSILSSLKNDGAATYKLQSSAISLNPYRSRFHATLSQTDLALASVISERIASGSGQTKENKENDQKLLSQLLQQAVVEARNATLLAPSNPFTWQALAETYTQMLGLATDADKFAVASFQKAISLNPTDPVLRLSFGNFYARNKDWNSALNQYLASVQLKPNYPNGFYNMAIAYRQLKAFYNEAVALRKTLSLIPKNDPDYQRVSTELDQAKAQLKPKELDMFEGKTTTDAKATPAPISPTPANLVAPDKTAPTINPSSF